MLSNSNDTQWVPLLVGGCKKWRLRYYCVEKRQSSFPTWEPNQVSAKKTDGMKCRTKVSERTSGSRRECFEYEFSKMDSWRRGNTTGYLLQMTKDLAFFCAEVFCNPKWARISLQNDTVWIKDVLVCCFLFSLLKQRTKRRNWKESTILRGCGLMDYVLLFFGIRIDFPALENSR